MEEQKIEIDLISIDIIKEEHVNLLFEHLEKKIYPISHIKLPSYEEHKEFVLSSPYRFWFFIKKNNMILGNCFISYQNCVGLNILSNKKEDYSIVLKFIFKRFKPLPAIKSIRSKYFHVNSNPSNKPLKEALISLEMNLIEETYIKKFL